MALAAYCTPMQASSLKKGSYIMLQGFPCIVRDYTSAKTGKHGGTKIHFFGEDIFTGKRKEEIIGSGENADVPTVKRTEYIVCDIADDYLNLMDESGESKDDIKVTNCTEEGKGVAAAWESFSNGENKDHSQDEEDLVVADLKASYLLHQEITVMEAFFNEPVTSDAIGFEGEDRSVKFTTVNGDLVGNVYYEINCPKKVTMSGYLYYNFHHKEKFIKPPFHN